jgi:hypothetical protein
VKRRQPLMSSLGLWGSGMSAVKLVPGGEFQRRVHEALRVRIALAA